MKEQASLLLSSHITCSKSIPSCYHRKIYVVQKRRICMNIYHFIRNALWKFLRTDNSVCWKLLTYVAMLAYRAEELCVKNT
jgi:hypothetical protein